MNKSITKNELIEEYNKLHIEVKRLNRAITKKSAIIADFSNKLHAAKDEIEVLNDKLNSAINDKSLSSANDKECYYKVPLIVSMIINLILFLMILI